MFAILHPCHTTCKVNEHVSGMMTTVLPTAFLRVERGSGFGRPKRSKLEKPRCVQQPHGLKLRSFHKKPSQFN